VCVLKDLFWLYQHGCIFCACIKIIQYDEVFTHQHIWTKHYFHDRDVLISWHSSWLFLTLITLIAEVCEFQIILEYIAFHVLLLTWKLHISINIFSLYYKNPYTFWMEKHSIKCVFPVLFDTHTIGIVSTNHYNIHVQWTPFNMAEQNSVVHFLSICWKYILNMRF